MSDVARGSSGGRSTPSLERASCALVASTSATVDQNGFAGATHHSSERQDCRSRVRRPPRRDQGDVEVAETVRQERFFETSGGL